MGSDAQVFWQTVSAKSPGKSKVHCPSGLCRHFFMHLPDNNDQLFKVPFVFIRVYSCSFVVPTPKQFSPCRAPCPR